MSFSYLTTAAGYSGGNYASGSGVTTLTYTATNAAPVGSLIAGGVFFYNSDATVTAVITDNATGSPNTYGMVQSTRDPISTTSNFLIYRCYNVQGSPTIWTLTLGGSNAGFSTSIGIQIDVFTGAKTASDPLDGSNINAQASVASGTNNIVSGSFTPSAAGDLIVCYIRQNTGYDATAGTGFTAASPPAATNASAIGPEYNLSGSSGSQQGTWNGVTAANAVTGAMAFLPVQVCGSLPLLGVGCSVGWRAALVGGAAWRAAKAIGRNETITRRRLLLP